MKLMHTVKRVIYVAGEIYPSYMQSLKPHKIPLHVWKKKVRTSMSVVNYTSAYSIPAHTLTIENTYRVLNHQHK